MADNQQQTEKSLRDIFYVLFRHKGKIITIFILAVIVTGFVVMSTPDLYQSDAKILVGGGRGSSLDMVTGMKDPGEVGAESELLSSRGFAESVVDRIGPEKILYVPEDYRSLRNMFFDYLEKIGILKFIEEKPDPIIMRENAIEYFMDTLELRANPSGSIIDITYYARTPELAQEILTTTVETYMEKHIEMHTTAVSMKFLTEETERLQKELAKSEAELRKFQAKVDIISLPEQQSNLLRRITSIQTAIEETEANIQSSRATIREMRGKLEMRDLLREEEIQLASLEARLKAQRNQLLEAKKELNMLKVNEQHYLSLQRKVEMEDENYRRYLASLEQARIAQTLESQKISNVSIMQKPTLLLEPVSQERKKTLALGLFVGIVGGVGLAFFLEYLNHKVRTVEEMEKRFAILQTVAIPTVNTNNVANFIRKKEIKENKKFVIRPKEMSKHVAAWLYSLKDVRNCFEGLRSIINEAMERSEKFTELHKPYILAVTSCYRKEGVSTIASGIAFTYSLYEKENVLLVDANLHHPETDRVTGMNTPKGLYEMTIKSQIPSPKQEKRFDLYSSIDMAEDLSQMEDPNKINKLLPSIQKLDYKLIVLDLQSVSEGMSAVHSGGVADGVILVIESEKVRREVVNRARDQLTKAGAHIICAVLNKRKFYIPRWFYRKM